MTDPVAWLVAELDRVEQLARRAQGAWAGQADGWRINIVDEQGRTVAYLPNRLTAEDPEGDYATATLIEDNDPRAVLRRVAADRRILAEHAPDRGDCKTCADPESYSDDAEGNREWYRSAELWPCRTVLLLAEAWGWTEEAQ